MTEGQYYNPKAKDYRTNWYWRMTWVERREYERAHNVPIENSPDKEQLLRRKDVPTESC